MKFENPKTLPHLFEASVERHGTNVMMWEKGGDAYRGSTYIEMQSKIRRCAAGCPGEPGPLRSVAGPAGL